jgi:hypothetical protein
MFRRSSTPRLLGLALFTALSASVVGAQVMPDGKSLGATRQAPDEFGTQDYTVTTISAASFTHESDDTATYIPYYTNGGTFERYINQSGNAHFYAGVSIPSGAVIDFIGLEGTCTAANLSAVELFLEDRFGTITSVGSVDCTQHSGMDTDYNSTALGFQLAHNVHNQLLLQLGIAKNATDFGAFSWVEIWWKRGVSPPPATASFNDVPTNHPFFQFIEALKASGITSGCQASPPLYCPDSPLTRGQMAVFLSKALGLHWPN